MKFFTLLALVFSFSAMAKTVDVECKMIEQAFRNQFAVEFSFDDEAQDFEDMELNLSFKKNGRDTNTEDLTLVRSGTIKMIAAGEWTREAVFILNSTDRALDPIYVNLVVGTPSPLSSTIRFTDGMTYFSSCKVK